MFLMPFRSDEVVTQVLLFPPAVVNKIKKNLANQWRAVTTTAKKITSKAVS
jgi:hypothetical protein